MVGGAYRAIQSLVTSWCAFRRAGRGREGVQAAWAQGGVGSLLLGRRTATGGLVGNRDAAHTLLEAGATRGSAAGAGAGHRRPFCRDCANHLGSR